MHLAEIPLLIFTIMAQMSVGAFLVLGVIDLIGSARWGAKKVELIADPALYAIGPTLVLGFAGSFLHLGTPFNAANSMNHLGTSWMSREILVGVCFGAVGGIYALSQLFHWFSPRIRQGLAILTALIGVVLVYVMAALYQLPTVPAWNTWTTTAQFAGTTVLLGAMAVAVSLTWPINRPVRYLFRDNRPVEQRSRYLDDIEQARHDLTMPVLHVLTIVAILSVGFITVVNLAWLGHLTAQTSAAAQTSLAVVTEHGGLWLILHLGLALMGTAVMGIFLFRLGRARRGTSKRLISVVALAFVLVFVGEVVGRLLFYSAYERLGF